RLVCCIHPVEYRSMTQRTAEEDTKLRNTSLNNFINLLRRPIESAVQFSTCGIGSTNSSLLPSQCFSCCSLRAPSLKSRKYQAISLSGLEAVNSPCLSYFPNQVFPIKTGPYLPLTATCMS